MSIETIQSNYSLKSFNTFGIDAKAKLYAEFHTPEELRQLLNHSSVKSENKLILGGGSNILFTKDFDGVVLRNVIKGIAIIKEDSEFSYVKAAAGEVWHHLVEYTIQHNLGGIENLSLIPGTSGAAPIQNIGAYGVEIKDVLESLEAINIATGEIRAFTNEECCFGYRDSIFKKELKGKYIVLSITLKLKKKPVFNTSYGAIQHTLEELGYQALSVKAISEAVCKIRKSKLPDPAIIGNAGSFFKNPEVEESLFNTLKQDYPEIPSFKTAPGKVKVPAGWLIEQCGWKGKKVGGTGVHTMQALVLVNHGNALGAEVKTLAEAIQQSVKDKFGIPLEMEVNVI